jgi:CMP-N-acetylneuraminic acid synthetase
VTTRVLGLVVARAGSKRLPGKNLRPFLGVPLIAHTIAAAQAATRLDRLVLSTEDAEIARVARDRRCDAPFVRPAALAADGACSADVALHALDALEAQGERFDVLVLLQPTSPLRTPEDIDACVARVLEGGAQACVAVTRPPGAVGHYGFMDEAGRLDLATARTAGAGRAIATLSGACYAVQVETLRRGGTFLPDDAACVELPWRRYADIDTAEDFAVAERMARVLWEEGLGWRPLAGGAR